jgi:hypothetical protein
MQEATGVIQEAAGWQVGGAGKYGDTPCPSCSALWPGSLASAAAAAPAVAQVSFG